MPKIYESDTIAAISTALGEGGIGIVRLSGPDCISIAEKVFDKKDKGPWESHRLYYGHVVDKKRDEIIDEALSVFMKGPRSYTMEDILEIQCHGGSLVTQRVLELVLKKGSRPAEPGEFTKRAFLNGRIDLTQAEAVIDLIRAKTSAGQTAASEQLAGRFRSRLTEAKGKLSSVLTHLEAYIDFPEENIEISTKEGFLKSLSEARAIIQTLVSSYEEGRVYRDGLTTAIVGKPNVGKSSLLNLLLKEKRAIVTSVPGTTRDVIEEYMNIKGVPLKLADTAGIRETDDIVELEGVRLARELIDRADIVLFVVDGSRPLTDDDMLLTPLLKGKKVILVINKTDMPRALTDADIRQLSGDMPVVHISAARGDGAEDLHGTIFNMAIHGKSEPSGGMVITRARHRDVLQKALNSIYAAVKGVEDGVSPEFSAIDLRASLDAMGDIAGETTPDEILNRIFSEFCIGK